VQPGLKYNFGSNLSYPISFGEYAHLNCYNHRELLTDPGVRVNWATGVQEMIERILNSTVLGGCYWAGIDDQFYMPALTNSQGKPQQRRLVGYGPWGIIDNWRRMKPEAIACRNMCYLCVIIIMSGTLD
jgi:beta-galactosidase